MTFQIYLNNIRVEIRKGYITSQNVDAIVNAANSALTHGAGVAGAIARKGGEIIQKESEDWIRSNGLVTNEQPAVTSGGLLQCKYIIHAVGPIWGEGDENHKLEVAVLSSLQKAEDLGCRSISIPAISTGIFGFPVHSAASIFLSAIEFFSQSANHKTLREIYLILFDDLTLSEFTNAFSKNNPKVEE